MATHPIRFGIQTGQQGVERAAMLMTLVPYFTDEIQAFAEEVMPAVRRGS